MVSLHIIYIKVVHQVVENVVEYQDDLVLLIFVILYIEQDLHPQ